MTAPTPASAHGARIHDLGYRGYDGPRLGEGGVTRALFVQGLRHAYGLGRSRRAKWLPVGILLVSLLPALVMVAVVAMTKLPTLPVDYARYPTVLQMVTSIFVAAQAPVVFSRDLRYRAITLYLARPLHRGSYVLARLASLFVAVLMVVGLPVVILYVGALLAGLPAGEHTRKALEALPGILVLTALLTVVGGVLASLATRRGMAIVAIIATLTMSSAVAGGLGAILSSGYSTAGIHPAWPGVLNPFSLAEGLGVWWFDQAPTGPPVQSTVDGVFYLVALVLTLLGGVAILLRRYAKAGAA
ncbi:hypothetical protein [Arsenicicoccus dermatophilus]|uniref:hypothetical protein n=1 Tax=Arsenicicoccus dermatophilus TaxID=1076331 RepID=UPI003916F6B2